jgi:hypothetical protein
MMNDNNTPKRTARPVVGVSTPLHTVPTPNVVYIPLIEYAIYENIDTRDHVTFLGARGGGRIVLQRANGSYIELTYTDFSKDYKDTGKHDHDRACCTVHNTHTSPHTGCLLR